MIGLHNDPPAMLPQIFPMSLHLKSTLRTGMTPVLTTVTNPFFRPYPLDLAGLRRSDMTSIEVSTRAI